MTQPRYLSLTIPEPCHENWQQMRTVDEYRRHCASCATVVTDFSSMSDEEIVSYLQQRAGQKTCGRLLVSQLNRPLPFVPQQKKKAVWWKAAVLLPFSLFFSSLKAQQTAQTDVNSFTTAEKDSVLMMPSVAEQKETVAKEDSVNETTPVVVADTAQMNQGDTGLSDKAIVESSPGGVMANLPFPLSIYQMMAVAGGMYFEPINPEPLPDPYFSNIARPDEEEIRYYQQLQLIASRITRFFSPKKEYLAVHHPASDSHAGILPPETRVAVPESRKRTKNNPRA